MRQQPNGQGSVRLTIGAARSACGGSRETGAAELAIRGGVHHSRAVSATADGLPAAEQPVCGAPRCPRTTDLITERSPAPAFGLAAFPTGCRLLGLLSGDNKLSSRRVPRSHHAPVGRCPSGPGPSWTRGTDPGPSLRPRLPVRHLDAPGRQGSCSLTRTGVGERHGLVEWQSDSIERDGIGRSRLEPGQQPSCGATCCPRTTNPHQGAAAEVLVARVPEHATCREPCLPACELPPALHDICRKVRTECVVNPHQTVARA
jgi:hypothetical protein